MKPSSNPEANPANVATCGKARFTALTDRMFRMEWAEDGKFEDSATLAVVNRHTPKVRFKVKQSEKAIEISTGSLTLRCADCGKPFSKDTLRAEFKMEGGTVRWRFGAKDPLNLKGTLRTLDGYRGDRKEEWAYNDKGVWSPTGRIIDIDLCPGLVSRSGWAVHDDSQGILLKEGIARGRPWVAPRPEGRRIDIYLLAYGLDYKAALKDASMIFGCQPLPPRFAFGYWYSRYWAYTDKEIEELAEQFDSYNVPLDVMVIDMDWHLPGWTGYTWCPDFFPNPKEFLDDLKERGLKMTLNLHPADGVKPHEAQFKAVCKDMGLTPAKTEKIPFDCTDPAFIESYFKRLHHPLEDEGVDFWWMDWQQGQATKMQGLDPLPWLNRLHWEDQERRGKSKRPICFSRFGGLGAGRHPVGFSGDTVSVWESLAYQPHFTATAANVLYGYWSHDIGGHMPGPIEPELYTRWMQFGIFSPILRTHTTKNMASERRVWEYPAPHNDIMAACIRRRYEMLPYIYAECRKCMDSGLSIVRPMYHEFPKEEAAYKAKGQYMFGDAMLVAPVTRPIDASDEMAQVEVWLPKGEWVDASTGQTFKGGSTVKLRRLLEEIPVFARKGTLIPLQKTGRRIMPGSCKDLILEMHPGADAKAHIYEDDGISQDYLSGGSAIIPLSMTMKRGGGLSLFVGKAEGSFKGFLKQRTLELRIFEAAPPKSVKAGGRNLPWSRKPAADSWTYDADNAAIKIFIKSLDLSKGLKVDVEASPSAPASLASGLKGLMARLDKLARYVNMVSPAHPLHPQERLATKLAQTGNRINRNPASFKTEIAALKRELPSLPKVLKEYAAIQRAREDAPKAGLLEKALGILDSTLKEFKRR